MRILHVVPLISDRAEYGGPARGTMRQARLEADRGHDVTVAALFKGPQPHDDQVDVISFPARKLPFVRGFGGLASLRGSIWIHRNLKYYDVCHVHAGREFWVLLGLWKRRSRTPVVLQTHGMLNHRSGLGMWLYDRLLTSGAYRRVASAMFLTSYERRQLEVFGWFTRFVNVLNGVDHISPRGPENLTERRLRVVTTTRLHPRKRVPDLVSAVARVAGTGRDLDLTIYGPDEGDLSAIEQAIIDSGSGDYIRYGGALAYERVREVLSQANAYVLPSVAEPFPNSLLEALATGVPAIATTRCGLSPYMADRASGLVVEPGVDGLAEGLQALYDDIDLRVRLSENALAMCEDTFAIQVVIDSLLAEYEAVGEGRK